MDKDTILFLLPSIIPIILVLSFFVVVAFNPMFFSAFPLLIGVLFLSGFICNHIENKL